MAEAEPKSKRAWYRLAAIAFACVSLAGANAGFTLAVVRSTEQKFCTVVGEQIQRWESHPPKNTDQRITANTWYDLHRQLHCPADREPLP